LLKPFHNALCKPLKNEGLRTRSEQESGVKSTQATRVKASELNTLLNTGKRKVIKQPKKNTQIPKKEKRLIAYRYAKHAYLSL
jgi:hypothetical protein